MKPEKPEEEYPESENDILEASDGLRRGGFAIVETLVIRCPILSATQVRLYADLCTYVGPGRSSWPTVKSLAYDIGVKPEVVSSNLSHLIKIGLVRKDRVGPRWQWILTSPPQNSRFWDSVSSSLPLSLPFPESVSPSHTLPLKTKSKNLSNITSDDEDIDTDHDHSLDTSSSDRPNAIALDLSEDRTFPSAIAARGGKRPLRVRMPVSANWIILKKRFEDLHEELIGEPYFSSHDKDMPLFRKLVKTYGLDKSQALIELYFQGDETQGFSVGGLIWSVHKLIPRVHEQIANQKRQQRARVQSQKLAARHEAAVREKEKGEKGVRPRPEDGPRPERGDGDSVQEVQGDADRGGPKEADSNGGPTPIREMGPDLGKMVRGDS